MPAFLLLFIPCFLRLFFLHGTAVYNLLCKNRSSNISTQLCVILYCVLFLEIIFKATQPEITLRAGTCQIMLLCSTDFTKYFITPQSALCARSDVEFVVVNVMKVKELLLFWTIVSTTAFSVSPTCIFIIMNKDNRNRTWKCCFSFVLQRRIMEWITNILPEIKWKMLADLHTEIIMSLTIIELSLTKNKVKAG